MNNLHNLVLNRKKLYEEIWELSAAGVAKKYNLHYAKLINSLKENDIPYPPSGYWTRLACGKDVSGEVIPLPAAKTEDISLYMAGYSSAKRKKNEEQTGKLKKNEILELPEENIEDTNIYKEQNIVEDSVLSFLEGEERECVIEAISNAEVKQNAKLHPVLVAYKKSIQEWKQREKEIQYSMRRNSYDYYRVRKMEQPVFLNDVSEDGSNRVIAILDVLYKTIEKLGGTIKADFSMQIKADVVRVSFAEGQDKRDHEITKQEAKELLEYKEKLRFHEYASKPQIKKYDYFYNGKLRIKFDNGKYIRDNEQQRLEGRLDEILVQLYEISEEYRIAREERELEHQIYLEEQRRKEERAERIVEEKRKTQALTNEAKDYQTASEIRKYIQAVINNGKIMEEKQDWLKWAEAKADWYDPIIARQDEYLGRRKHEADENEKQLKKEVKRGYGW